MSEKNKRLTDSEIEANRNSLLEKLKEANGKTIGEIDTSNLLNNPKNKGRIGQVIQKYLGKDLDSDKDKDFPEAKLELKVTGLLPNASNKKGYRAKERLVLTDINFNTDYKDDFENSHLINKCNDILMTCYEYIKRDDGESPSYKDFPIVDSFIMTLSEEDKKILKDDYDLIMNKIKRGEADRISESDTNYLSACTKARDSSVKTTQPFSDILAKPRAFALKSSFLTSIIEHYISHSTFENVMNQFCAEVSFDDFVLSKLRPWFGNTERELRKKLDVSTDAKNRFRMYVNRIFKTSDIEQSDEFKKANISIKTIRIQKSGAIKEKMSFPQMDFYDVAYTPWEESSVREYFSEKRFLFLIFKETPDGYIFNDAFFYNFADEIIDEFIRYTYEKTQKVLLRGEIVKSRKEKFVKGEIKTIHSTNFVGIKENPICHVRPHASNFADQSPLPVRDKITDYWNYEKQCFWIDTRFIKAIAEKNVDQYLAFARKRLAEHK